MKKCSICGKPALEVVEVCPECLQRAAVDPRQIKRLTYNKYKPNRQARRLGIKAETPPKQEEHKRVSKAEVLRDRVQQAKEAERRIVPQGMTYGEYLQYLKGKRQELEGKRAKSE